jgi:hypothetical protein
VCQWLQEDAGITVSIPSLRSYISRSRRKDAALRKAEAATVFFRAAGSDEHRAITDANPVRQSTFKDGSRSNSPDESPSAGDPMALAKRALNKTGFDVRKIHGDGDPTGKNLI